MADMDEGTQQVTTKILAQTPNQDGLSNVEYDNNDDTFD